jgi:hypothetical protein
MKLTTSLSRGALFLATLFLITACATPRGPAVRSDFDRAVNFSAYKTFGFPESTGTDRGGYTTLVTSHFKDAVRREMTSRGYTYAESSPDLIVNFYSELKDKTRVYSRPGWAMSGAWGYPYGYRPRYGFYSAWPFFYDNDIDVVQYKSGNIKLDVVDAARKQVIWEANVEEPLSDQAQDNPQPMISRLVTELFKKFPSSSAG